MFDSLQEKLNGVFKKLKGKGKLTEKDVEIALREIRIALLEADVNYKVVKQLVAAVRERAVGHEVLNSLTPAQQVIKIVREELTKILEQDKAGLKPAGSPPTVILMAGLQGSGKTTTSVKLANYLRTKGNNPLLAAADLRRPGAVQQLVTFAGQAGLPVFTGGSTALEVGRGAAAAAHKDNHDYLIVDTSGRMHIVDELMQELVDLKDALNPGEILLVIDAMTGQDAVNIAGEFNRKTGLTGVILTKLDGDTRGGAALSVKAVTGCPIKFVGTSEKIDGLEPFYPERMVKRIMGMGDVLTLIEKAEATFNEEQSRELEKKLMSQQFTLEDFQEQLQQFKKLGSMEEIMEMLPGGGLPKEFKNMSFGEDQIKRIEAIISSMTLQERRNPQIINSSRRRRIARGSGNQIQDVNRLLKQFDQMKKMIKKLGNMDKKTQKKMKKKMKGFSFM